MKRIVAFLTIVLLLALCACDKKPEAVSGQDLPKPEAVKEAAPNVPIGYVLRSETGFYEITGTDAKWKSSLSLGDQVSVLNEVVKANFEKKEYEFAKIKKDDGKEGFVLPAQIATNGELAVISGEKTNVYKTAKNVDVTGTILPRLTVLVVFPSTAKDNFIAFTAYDTKNKTYVKEKFIKTTEYSSRASDVQSAILLQTAIATTDATRKQALLDSALQDYPDSVFLEEISLAAGNSAPSSEKKIRTTTITGTINAEKVILTDKPDENSGKVLGFLAAGTEVVVIEETVDTFTLDGKTDKWYHVSSPNDGWIHGSLSIK